ncbi:MAG: hypothetical protein ABL931_13115 [Usitatibacteraceae bacterium]
MNSPVAGPTPVSSQQRRFLVLLSVLAALLAARSLIITKAFVEQQAFRNVVGIACVSLVGPLAYFAIEVLFAVPRRIGVARGLRQIKIRLPVWVHKLAVGTLVALGIALIAYDYFDISRAW